MPLRWRTVQGWKWTEEMLREMDLFSLEKKSQRGDLIAVFHCLKDSCGEKRGRLFSEAAREIVTESWGEIRMRLLK